MNAGSTDSINSATSAISALRFSFALHVCHVTGTYRCKSGRAENPQRSRKRFLPLLLHYHFCNKWCRAPPVCSRVLTYVGTTVGFPNSVTIEEARRGEKRRAREREKERTSEGGRRCGNSTGNNNRTDFNGYCALRLLTSIAADVVAVAVYFPNFVNGELRRNGKMPSRSLQLLSPILR